MFLRRNRALLGFADTDRDLHFRRGDRDSLNRRHLRFNVNHLGLSVWPAELIVHLDPDGNVDLLSGGYQRIPSSLAVDPIVSSDVALASSIANVAGGDEVETSGHQLIIYAPLARRPRLAWKIELSVSIDTLWLVFVDALNGIVLNAYNQVTDAGVAGSGVDLFGDDRDLNLWQQNTTYYMVDTSKAMFDPTSDPASPNIENIRGAIVIKDAQNQPSTSDPTSLPELMQVTSNTGSATSGWLADAVSATFGLSETYDYFLERHGRDSLDGAGGTITAVVRYAQNYQNASWNPGVQLMLFGDGLPFARALDVVGHELTHGVTTNSADLVYQGQSGALNEAFSDIFGEMVEARTKGTPDWLKGGPDLGLTIQNYANPTSINCLSGIACPANMSDFINTTQDNGGVHLNSSIINHAFYVLAEGLTGAIGLSDAERIFYRTLTTKLVRSSQFIDARLGAIASAEELFGPDSTQVQKTAEAFDTVKIFDAPSTPPPPTTPGVIGPDSTAFVFFDPLSGDFLRRREEALGDGPLGVPLSTFSVARTRPSVSGDGTLVAFVDGTADFCFVDTKAGSVETCIGVSGTVFSAAMSPDQNRFAFVLLDDEGEPSDSITIIDLAPGGSPETTFPLQAPLLDGGTIDVVRADAMAFSADGNLLVYDALNDISYDDGTRSGLWSIYALDLVANRTLTVVPPAAGLDVGFPAFSQTSDEFLTFETYSPASGTATVYAASLFTGDLASVASVENAGLTVPGYTGDDAAIVYAVPDGSATGSSLVLQTVAADRITPQGAVQPWLTDAEFGVIYRRGSFTPPVPFNLSVTKSGDSDGLVTSTPEGIACGADCEEVYAAVSSVNLVANPDSDTLFVGWNGGGCSGAGVCTVTITSDIAITADFRLDSDGDGMPDTFESANGFDPEDPSDAALDNDNDGSSNLEEFNSGRNPLINEPVFMNIINLILLGD